MAKKKQWEDAVLERVANKFEPTYLGAAQPNVPLEQQPNFKIYGFTPNRKLDGDKRHLLAGPEWSIMQQSSVLKNLHDILGDRLGYNFTFEDWFKDWQEGFKWGINRSGTAGMRTNFPIRSTSQGENTIPGWREDIDSRPAYLEWKNPNNKLNKNYRVIEYWPNKSSNKSYVLSGSVTQIIQQILQIEYEGSGSATATGEDGPQNNFEIEYKGAPAVTLYFYEKQEDVEQGYQPIQGKIKFRLVGKTVEETPLIPRLTGQDVQQLALRIQQAFLVPEPFSYRRGKEVVSIDDRYRGLVSYQYVYSEAEGWNLYSRVYQAMGLTIDDTKVNHSTRRNSTAAFPTIPPTTNIIGSTVKERRKRPVGTVYFAKATLYLSKLSRSVQLCNDKGYVFQSLDEGLPNVS